MILKNIFDYIIAIILLIFIGWIIVFLVIIATIDTGKWGIFSQQRVGRNAKIFNLYKIRTMKDDNAEHSHITVRNDQRITRIGAFLRNKKLDELPQLFNILLGQMSLVGPRPDVIGYADKLEGKDRIILTVKPGITCPATLKYRNEEGILANVANPINYNNTVIWPEKVRLNREYVENWSFKNDIKILLQTIL